MVNQKYGPKIIHISWGRIEVEGHEKPFRDAKLYPGGGREWDWSETGTEHVPGIQPADVEELIEKGAKEVVLSKGMYERLQVCPETLQFLKDRNISTYVLQTEEAVRLYNKLRNDRSVGGLFHTTC
jgi:hypothetical protein